MSPPRNFAFLAEHLPLLADLGATAERSFPFAPQQRAQTAHQNHLIRWRAGPNVLPKFAVFFLLSPQVRNQIESVASSTTGLHTLSVSRVSELRILVPELGLQTEIVRRVEALFAFADCLEARLKRAQAAVDRRLTPALLSKAFRGELVPQDPAEETAAELLKRLAAQRDSAPAKPRKRQATHRRWRACCISSRTLTHPRSDADHPQSLLSPHPVHSP